LNIEDDSGAVVVKRGLTITMKDDNGKTLDFIISHVEDGEEREEGTWVVVMFHVLCSIDNVEVALIIF
jgi:hypothetical protein